MLPEANDSESQLSKYLAWKDKDEAKPIPKKDEKLKDDDNKIKDEAPDWKDKKNDDTHEYEYSDNKDEDDKNW